MLLVAMIAIHVATVPHSRRIARRRMASIIVQRVRRGAVRHATALVRNAVRFVCVHQLLQFVARAREQIDRRHGRGAVEIFATGGTAAAVCMVTVRVTGAASDALSGAAFLPRHGRNRSGGALD